MNSKLAFSPTPGKKHFFYYPSNVAIVGVSLEEKTNFMPCAWNTGLSYDPFLYGVSIGLDRTTREMLDAKQKFSVNFVDYVHHGLVRSIGRSRGAEINKPDEFQIEFSAGHEVDCPILDCAYLSYECDLFSRSCLGDHVLYVGEMKYMHVDKDVHQNLILDNKAAQPLLYLGVDHYITTDGQSLKNLKHLPFHYKEKD